MIRKLLSLIGYSLTTEVFNYPVVDGTYKYQTKRAVELFLNPFQLTGQKRIGGKCFAFTIQKEVGDEYSID
jgi:hypothetical protein